MSTPDEQPAATPSPYAPWAKAVAVAAHLGVFAIAATLFAFAEPLADDFCRGGVKEGVLAYVKQHYLEWSGRWASHGLEVFVLTRLETMSAYPLLVGAIAAFELFALYVFLRTFFKGFSRSLAAALTVGFFVLFWSGHPDVGQGIYWFTGSVENQLNTALTLILFTLLLNPKTGQDAAWFRAVRVTACPLLAFVIMGMHELLGLMVCIVLVGGVAVTQRARHPDRNLWIAVATVSAASLAVVIAAPGNEVRRAGFVDSYNLLLSLRLAVAQAVKAGTRWVFDIKLLAATALFVLHPGIRNHRPRLLLNPSIPWKWLVPATWLMLLALGFWGPVFTTGMESAGRTLGGIYFVFLAGWFLTVFVMTRPPGFPELLTERALRPVSSVLLLVFSLSALTTGNTRVAVHDLIHKVRPWHRAAHERYRLIRKSLDEGKRDLVVSPQPDWPNSFYRVDVVEDPADWKNHCLAQFFALDSVTMQKTE